MLKGKDKETYQKYGVDLDNFYTKLKRSSIFWVNQSPPRGFGHAVLQAESYVGHEDFFVLAGDTLIISDGSQHLCRLINCFDQEKSDVALLLKQVDHPESYGVAQGIESSDFMYINKVIEKPKVPQSDMAIMPVYIFKSSIFGHLKGVAQGIGNEIQLTDAIQSVISSGGAVVGTRVNKDELVLDIGSPHLYFKAQTDSYNYGVKMLHGKKL
jgi:UTP-glucose-1-phosphate uridylyltransferase